MVAKPQQQLVVNGLVGRFNECVTEKNGTLIRYDIIQGLPNLYDAVQDEEIREKALVQHSENPYRVHTWSGRPV